MDNHEDYLDALTAYARNPGPEIPAVLERYLSGVANNGETLFQWPLLKPLIVGKMEQVIQELEQGLEAENIPTRPNVENVRFEVMHARIMDAVHKFTGAPFTIQRLCELLLEPKRHYKRSDKFMRGLEKNVLVVSTVDPFGRKVVSESSNKHLVNGMDGSSSPLLPRDPHNSTPLPPVPDWVTSPAAHRGDSQQTAGQETGINTNGVAEALVSSVYTDQGEQPMSVQSEEVVEETVVTMETNEVASVTDGGEALAEVEEEMGVEDTNASSSSSSSSSSEELSVSDSSEGTAPSTSVTSSTEGQPAERPWACLDDTPLQPTDLAWSQGNNPHTSPSSDGEATEDAPLAWHPVADPTDSSSSSSSSSASSSSNVASSSSSPSTTTQTTELKNGFEFETVTTSAGVNSASIECSTQEGSAETESQKSSVPLEDSGGVNDSLAPPSIPTASVIKETADFSGSILPATTEVITSSSVPPAPLQDSAILSPSAPPVGYPECDSVAGLERLVSSVDAASPIAVLSSSSSLDSSPFTTHAEDEDSSSEEGPQAKRSKMIEEEESEQALEDDGPLQADITSTTASHQQNSGEDNNKSSQEEELSEAPSQPDNSNKPSADTTSENEKEAESEACEENDPEAVSGEDSELASRAEEDKDSGAQVSSPPSQLSSSSSSSDSTGFDMACSDGAGTTKADTEQVSEDCEEAKVEAREEAPADEPMDQQ